MPDAPEVPRAPMTVGAYAATWLAARRARDVGSARDDAARLEHALPSLGALDLTEVRPRHIRELVRQLRAEGRLAPRTIRHVYTVLHVLFHDAVVDELMVATPCVVKRGDLPKLTDKDPFWRSSAVFTHEEVDALLSDERIPTERRVLYTLLATAGVRFGEASAFRWSAYDADAKPLGKILVAESFDSKRRKTKSVKSQVPRAVPAHPVLAEVLAAWWNSHWARFMGRPPTREDLVLPTRRGAHQVVNLALRHFHADCARLGLRLRRLHDLRRSFVTLTLADGARRNVLEEVSHGRRGDIMSLYNTTPWEELCAAVACLRISLRPSLTR